jgi:hypothetical protein
VKLPGGIIPLGLDLEHKESAPVNSAGDRLIVKGEPGPMEKAVRVRRYRSRVQAEERILSFVEKLDGVCEMLSVDQRTLLVRGIRTLICRAVREDRLRISIVLRDVWKHLPEDLTVPDPRDQGAGMLGVANLLLPPPVSPDR